MWAGKQDETQQAQCLEEKQWPTSAHDIPQRHTDTKHPRLSGKILETKVSSSKRLN